MDRKTFLIIALIITAAGVAGAVVKYQTPKALIGPGWGGFPLQKDDWLGHEDVVAQGVIDLLKPDHLFNANYADNDGHRVNLFLGSFSDPRGGPHSPMNCLPASGWIVESSEPRSIEFGGRVIRAKRLHLRFRQTAHVMDFWYITTWGETASDYQLKLFQMMTSLTLQPRHLTFVRFVAKESPESLAALDRFEAAFLADIYSRLPIGAR
ncbi:MAG: exosortase C-terminal domain/associated protein EpsI [Candidatus Zixiibacteriota bacterium]